MGRLNIYIFSFIKLYRILLYRFMYYTHTYFFVNYEIIGMALFLQHHAIFIILMEWEEKQVGRHDLAPSVTHPGEGEGVPFSSHRARTMGARGDLELDGWDRELMLRWEYFEELRVNNADICKSAKKKKISLSVPSSLPLRLSISRVPFCTKKWRTFSFRSRC